MIVLHETLDSEWLFVQSKYTKGWIEKNNIALTNRENFMKYVEADDFVIVTAKNISINNIHVDMGIKLLLDHENQDFYHIKYPIRNQNSTLGFGDLKINKDANFLHRGYLPYTTSNLVKQLLEYHGTPYGWAGTDNGIDCSGLILNSYSVFGFEFPRNSARQQSMAGNIFEFNGENKEEILNKIMPGSLLYFPGHIMAYLGKMNDKHYIIHSCGFVSENGKKVRVMKVVISDLSELVRVNGNKFMDELKTATEIK